MVGFQFRNGKALQLLCLRALPHLLCLTACLTSLKHIRASPGSKCSVHVHRWIKDGDFLNGQLYDNIIMDYLIGGEWVSYRLIKGSYVVIR